MEETYEITVGLCEEISMIDIEDLGNLNQIVQETFEEAFSQVNFYNVSPVAVESWDGKISIIYKVKAGLCQFSKAKIENLKALFSDEAIEMNFLMYRNKTIFHVVQEKTSVFSL